MNKGRLGQQLKKRRIINDAVSISVCLEYILGSTKYLLNIYIIIYLNTE